jgi:hypothetical protein
VPRAPHTNNPIEYHPATIVKVWLHILLTALVAQASACRSAANKEKEALSPRHLTFVDAASKTLFFDFRDAFAERTRGSGWEHRGPLVGGNFLTETWSRGKVVYELSVLHQNLPEVFGVAARASGEPDRNGRSVRFWYAAGGRTLLGSGCNITVEQAVPGKDPVTTGLVTYSASLADPFAWGDDTLTLKRATTCDEEMRLMTVSAESFRSTAHARFVALQGTVDQAFSGNLIRKKHDRPSVEELATLKAQVRAEIDRQTQLIQREGDHLYDELIRLAPLDNVWKPR